MSGMIPFDEAIKLLLSDVHAKPAENISLNAALTRVLAEDVIAPRAQPPLAMSAMDGYAVQSADVAQGGTTLKVVGEVPAGGQYTGILQPGEAIRIFTGAPTPTGADRVVIQENTRRDGNDLHIEEAQLGGTNIRSAGIDFEKNQQLLCVGQRITAAHLGVMASANRNQVSVHQKPRVSIFSSGNELVEPGGELTDNDIINSGGFAVAGLVESLGGIATLEGILPDEEITASQMLKNARDRSDVIVTIGGASVGDYDIVKPSMKSLGAVSVFEKVAIKPGKPVWHARFTDGPLVLGLPGNPASAIVCAYLFLRPLLEKLSGQESVNYWRTGILSDDLSANGPRETFLRGAGEIVEGEYRVSAHSHQDSSLMMPFLSSNVLIRRPSHADPLFKGQAVEVLSITS